MSCNECTNTLAFFCVLDHSTQPSPRCKNIARKLSTNLEKDEPSLESKFLWNHSTRWTKKTDDALVPFLLDILDLSFSWEIHFDCQCNTCLFLDFLASELGRKAVFLCFISGSPIFSPKLVTKEVLTDLNRSNDWNHHGIAKIVNMFELAEIFLFYQKILTEHNQLSLTSMQHDVNEPYWVATVYLRLFQHAFGTYP